jgi:hypothetical protein
MNRHLIAATPLVAALLAGALLLGGGCEEDPLPPDAPATFRLEPASAAINLWSRADDGPLVLELSGGSGPFTWELTDDTLGALTAGGDAYARTAVYTAASAAEGLQRIIVRDRNAWEASCQVRQGILSIQLESAPASTPDTLTVTNAGVRLAVTVSGGTLPIGWSVSDPGLGTLAATTGRATWYTRSGAREGINTLTAVDADGLTVRATILQPD